MSRRPLLLLPLLALVALLAACGSGGSLSLDPVAEAASKTADSKTFKVEFKAAIDVQGMNLAFGGTGHEDLTARRAAMSFDLSSLPGLGSGGTMDIVFANDVMYMRMPSMAKALPSGKEWVKADVSKLRGAAGSSNLDLFSGADPAKALDQLRAAGDVKKVGEDTVQGETMTHYHAVIDPANARSLTPAQRKAVQKALAGMGGRVPTDVWVDDAGRLRRMQIDVAFGQGLQNAHMSMTMDYSDFGSPVDVQTPPADKVADFGALTGVPSAGAAATTPWAKEAEPICTRVLARVAALVPDSMPTTYDGRLKVARDIVPFEDQEVQQLSSIAAQPTAAEQRALDALRADAARAHAMLAKAGERAAFARAFHAWVLDDSAPTAFDAAGVGACAGG
jgi:predicted small lipoprotein YifL